AILFHCDDDHRALPSFPTRRSSDLIDFDGVGAVMKIGVEKGRSTRKDIKLGICGEHGGDPQSVMFCHKIGLDYVSCSPRRVPIRSEEHTSELQSRENLVCRLLLEKK